MNRSEAASTVARLNESSFSDAAGTRDEVVRLLRTLSGGARTSFIEELTVSAQARLRQAVARAVQIAGSNGEMAPIFERWLENETDEFVRAAIEDALTPDRRPSRRKQFLTDLDAVPRTYRFLADRLRHRVLNAMPGAGLSVTKLKDVAAQISNDQQRHALMKEVDYLSTTFARLQRALDFAEEKSRFERITLDLTEWLRNFGQVYRAEWQELDVRIIAPESVATIEAIPYLLETAFVNLFDNTRQVVETGGWIAIHLVVRSRAVRVEVGDSGPGLSDAVADAAFQMPVTTKGRRDRGRGFLEIADAMKRLGGRAEIIQGVPGKRVLLTFPLAR